MASASDNFNRADGSPGANWSGNMIISSNQITANTLSNFTPLRWVANTFSFDHYSQITLSARSGATENWIFAAVRMTSSTDALWFGARESSNTIRLDKLVSSSVTTVASTTASPAVAVGDIFRIEAVGSTITCYRNGVVIFSYNITDASLLSSGTIGLSGYNNSALTKGDDWEGGDLASTVHTRYRKRRQ